MSYGGSCFIVTLFSRQSMLRKCKVVGVEGRSERDMHVDVDGIYSIFISRCWMCSSNAACSPQVVTRPTSIQQGFPSAHARLPSPGMHVATRPCTRPERSVWPVPKKMLVSMSPCLIFTRPGRFQLPFRHSQTAQARQARHRTARARRRGPPPKEWQRRDVVQQSSS